MWSLVGSSCPSRLGYVVHLQSVAGGSLKVYVQTASERQTELEEGQIEF